MVPSEPAPDSQTERSNRAQVIHAAGIVAAAFVFSRVMGIGRDIVVGYYFGVDTLEVNAYTIANVFPETIFYVVAGGALGSAFIPTFTAYFARNDAAGGWRLFSAIINLILIVTTVVAGLTMLFAPAIVTGFYGTLIDREPALLPLIVTLMRVMLLSPIIFGVSGVFMGALNARQHFLLPAIAPIIYNLGIIGGALLFAPNVMGLAYGTVLGALGHLLIQLPGLRQQRARYQPILTLRDPGVRQVLRLMAPRVLGLSFGRINHLVTQFLAQSMVLGSIRALDLGWRFMIMPQSIIGQAMGIAAFPTFANLAAQSALGEMRRILSDTLRLIFFLGLPASVFLMTLRRPVIASLLEYGAFDAASTDLVVWALLFYGLGLVALAALEVIARAFYALEDTRTPVLAGGFQIVTMALLGLWLSRAVFAPLGLLALGGVALGSSLSNWLELVVLLWLLRRKMGGLAGWHMWRGIWRMVAAALMMAASVLVVERWLDSNLLILIIGGGVGTVVYVGVCWLLRVNEVAQVWAQIRRRLPGQRG